ncbi:MAG: hypothetical protein R2865_16115 [Deinococcales bacterium]
MDDAFKATSQPSYADGQYGASYGYNASGGLKISLGAIDNNSINNMSGAWQHTFSLSQAERVFIHFKTKLVISSEYESDEYSQMLVAVDNNIIGVGGEAYVLQITGDGNGGLDQSSGWQEVSLAIDLPPGQHVLKLGAFNNKKTASNEWTEVYLDDIQLMAQHLDANILWSNNFDQGSEDFSYVDNLFRNSQAPSYAQGQYLNNGGYLQGGLEVFVGGIDASNQTNISGGWRKTFNLNSSQHLWLSFRYKLSLIQSCDDGENAEAMVALDGKVYGKLPRDYVGKLMGSSASSSYAYDSTGWQRVFIDLGMVESGSHTLDLGAYLSQKTFYDEFAYLHLDDVVMMAKSNQNSLTQSSLNLATEQDFIEGIFPLD